MPVSKCKHWSSHSDICSSIYATLETNLDHLNGLLKEMYSPQSQ